jgi:type IV fimbrial biogenesis protein FimT
MWNNSIKSSGFTLVELMITLAIAGILVAVGIPSFSSTISSNRLSSYANEFVTALNLARSEAIRRGQNVVVRRIGTQQWENGWQVFVDVDRSSTANTNTFNDDGDNTLCEAGEDCMLRVYPALSGAFTLRGNNNFVNFIGYTPIGISNNIGSFVICDNSDGNAPSQANTSKLITVNFLGRPHMGIDSDSDGIPEKENGTEIVSCTVSPF